MSVKVQTSTTHWAHKMTVFTTTKGFGKVVSTRGVYKVYRLEKGVWKLLSKFTTTDRQTAEHDCRLCAN